MLRRLLDSVTLALLLALAIMALMAADRPPQLPLVRADYPVCVTVHNEMLAPKRHNRVTLYPRRSDMA